MIWFEEIGFVKDKKDKNWNFCIKKPKKFGIQGELERQKFFLVI